MRVVGRVRFSLRKAMLLVLTAGVAAALYVKIYQRAQNVFGTEQWTAEGWRIDAPVLFLLAIGLTAVALGSWRRHGAVPMMLQTLLACLAFLSLIWLGESGRLRPVRYWFEGTFAVLVALPLLLRRLVGGGRRGGWRTSCEAAVLAFANVLLVVAGILVQLTILSNVEEWSPATPPPSPPPTVSPATSPAL